MCRTSPMAVGVHFEQEYRLASPIITIKSFHSKSRNALYQNGTFYGANLKKQQRAHTSTLKVKINEFFWQLLHRENIIYLWVLFLCIEASNLI